MFVSWLLVVLESILAKISWGPHLGPIGQSCSPPTLVSQGRTTIQAKLTLLQGGGRGKSADRTGREVFWNIKKKNKFCLMYKKDLYFTYEMRLLSIALKSQLVSYSRETWSVFVAGWWSRTISIQGAAPSSYHLSFRLLIHPCFKAELQRWTLNFLGCAKPWLFPVQVLSHSITCLMSQD